MVEPSSREALASRIASVTWYHSLPLPFGLVTPGSFDNLDELARVPFPKSLAGRRCLDVATADGFWAFEMERRGASEVLAIDVAPDRLDWPGRAASDHGAIRTDGASLPGGFAIAHEALGSNVRWRELSVYELDPDDVGRFDFVFIGSVLGHLRDPVRALAAIRGVLQGELLSVDMLSAPLTILHPRHAMALVAAEDWPLWWVPNLQGYRRLFAAAGLSVLASGRPFFLKRGVAYCAAYGSQTAHKKGRKGVTGAISARLGNLHAWVRAAAS